MDLSAAVPPGWPVPRLVYLTRANTTWVRQVVQLAKNGLPFSVQVGTAWLAGSGTLLSAARVRAGTGLLRCVHVPASAQSEQALACCWRLPIGR